jgi:basic membrane protein A and related proteins
MKRLLFLIVLLGSVFALAACEARPAQIAMITDAGDIDDKSFNQGTWEGIVEFARANDKTYRYYKPTEVSFDAYVQAIDLAVQGGAEIIVTPGFLFENAVHKAQYLYPDVKFVLIDGIPHNVIDFVTYETYDGSDVEFNAAENTYSIFFKEEQSGFLGGYASVMEGFTELGFMGGMAVPAVVRFGIGFVAGAYYAANQLGNEAFEFDMTYYEYLDTFAPGEGIKNKAAAWYAAGLEVIHPAAGGAGNSVMAAANEAVDKWVVGVDVDQRDESPRVLTSAMKALGVVVQQALTDFFNEEFPGGQSVTLGAIEDAVGLPTAEASFRFTTFTLEQYEAIFDNIVTGEVVVPNSVDDVLDEDEETVLQLGLISFIESLGFEVPAGLADTVNPE